MKKVLFCLITVCSLVMASCSSDNDNPVSMSELNFDQARYSMAKGEVELKIISDKAATTTVSIPVSFSGTAVEGTDFTILEKAFTLKAGETEAVLTVTRILENIGDDVKELVVNLGTAPDGFKIGIMSYTTVELLSNKAILMSFNANKGILSESTSYGITLETLEGKPYKVTQETKLNIEVDPSSTAIEGTHFEFVGGKYATVLKNKNSGVVALKFLKKEEGKDKLVLRLAERDGYAHGDNATITLTINGPYLLAGTWAFDKVSNIEFYETMWGQDTSTFPTGNSSDKIQFEGNSHQEYTFTPTLNSDLKNYFGTSPCVITYKGEVEKTIEEESALLSQVIAKIAVLQFPAINVNFSAAHVNTREAVVGFRIIESDGKQILECTIDDFEPTDFMKNIYDMYKDFGEDPVMKSAPLRLHFTRVK